MTNLTHLSVLQHHTTATGLLSADFPVPGGRPVMKTRVRMSDSVLLDHYCLAHLLTYKRQS